MPAKYTPSSPLTDVRGLLSTGLLEGFPVTYKRDEVELNGFVKDLGYQCGCSSCDYTKVVSALMFEKHAGVTTNNQNNHIFLDNGITIYKLVNKLEGRCLGSLGEVIQAEIDSQPNMKQFEQWKALFLVNGNGMFIATNMDKTQQGCRVMKDIDSKIISAIDSSPCSTLINKFKRPQEWPTTGCRDLGFPTKKRGVKSSSELISDSPDQKDHDVIGSRVHIERKERSYFMANGNQQTKISKHTPSTYISDVKGLLSTGVLDGLSVTYKKDEGKIHGIISFAGYRCGCSSCNYNKVLSALEFEKHAGVTSKNQNDHIFLDNGISIYKLVRNLKDRHIKLGSLDKVIEKEFQIQPNMEHFENWKASFQVNINQKETNKDVDETQLDQPETHTADHSAQGLFGVAVRSGTNSARNATMKSSSSRPLEEYCPSLVSSVTPSSKYLWSTMEDNAHIASNFISNFRSLGSTESSGDLTPNVCMKPSFPVPSSNGITHVASSLNENSIYSQLDTVGIINLVLPIKTSPVGLAKEIVHTTPRVTVESISLRPPDYEFGSDPIMTMKTSSFQTVIEGSAHLASNVASNVCPSNSGLEDQNYPDPVMDELLSLTQPTDVVSEITLNQSSSGPANENDTDPAPTIFTEPGSSVPAVQESTHLFSGLSSSLCKDSDLPAHDSCIKQLQSLCILDDQSQLAKRMLMLPDLPYLSKSNGDQLKLNVTAQHGSKQRDCSLHQLIFKENGLPNGSKLAYCVKGEKIKSGYKFRNGLICDCCNLEMSPSQFEAHAGFCKRRQPYRHIYTSDGITLHELSIALFNSRNLTSSCSEVSCTICGTGGELVSCDGCTKSFHTVCLELQSVPDSGWYCSCCMDLRVRSGSAIPSSGAIRSDKLRSRLILKAETDQLLCCTLCKDSSFILNVFDAKTIIFCAQCEREYHIGCLKYHGVCDLKEVPMECNWFCCEDCDVIHASLQKLVNHGDNFVPYRLLSMLKRNSSVGEFADDREADIHWQILSGKYVRDDLLFHKIIGLFHEAFDPIVEGGQDLLSAMVHAEDVAGKLLGGVYCTIITVKSVIISAGLFRVFGRNVAELPLVATHEKYRGKGYFRVLFSLVERVLYHLEVDHLIVPASKEVQSLWRDKLGFVEMAEERAHLKDYPLMMFETTTMLEKAVPRSFDDGK
ncbi:unnamed protein product [Musa textilis]